MISKREYEYYKKFADNLSWFGSHECREPNLEDIAQARKVIERLLYCVKDVVVDDE